MNARHVVVAAVALGLAGCATPQPSGQTQGAAPPGAAFGLLGMAVARNAQPQPQPEMQPQQQAPAPAPVKESQTLMAMATPAKAAGPAVATALGAAATRPQSAVPEPVYGNGGAYMCPYTEDGVVADWVDKAVNARLGAAIGGQVGAYAGRRALASVPFVGGMLGQRAGEATGRRIAIEAAGGWDHIRATSDLSFNSLQEMSLYLYLTHSSHPHYQRVLDATFEIYPDMRDVYGSVVQQAMARR